MIQEGQIIDGYKIIKFLGSGSFSQVWMANFDDGTDWALKVFDKSIQEDFKLMVEKEYDEIVNLKHANIVSPKKYGYYTEGPYLIYPLCDGSLSYLITNRIAEKKKNRESIENIFSEKELANILLDLSKALIFLKEHKIIHQDIKPANILYKNDEQEGSKYFLSDFGTSFFINKTISKSDIYKDQTKDRYTTYGLSLGYAAPEVYKNNPIYYSDIFSLGVTAYEMACGDLPSKSQNLGLGYALLHESVVPDLPGNYSSGFKSFIKSMMNRFPENRPDANEIFRVTSHYMQTGIWQVEREVRTRGETGFLTKGERISSRGYNLPKSPKTRKSNIIGIFAKKYKNPFLIFLAAILVVLILFFMFFKDGTAQQMEVILHDAKISGHYAEAIAQLQQLSTDNLEVSDKIVRLQEVIRKYERIDPFVDDVAVVSTKNAKGTLNSDFQEIIPAIYTAINISHDIVFVQSKDNLWGAFDKDGKSLLKCEFIKIEFSPDFSQLIAFDKNQNKIVKVIH
ncbi:MAG: serine/threonine-protein kinase [Saprospiraceae bacterium]|nr:serine/threonine-protein kinase [Saprospiraceae bacterium]MBK9728131.1 serine/threonine-protein kinase [Saprospiraceae bacterium]